MMQNKEARIQQQQKVCINCHAEKAIEHYVFDKSKGKYKSKCKECCKEHLRKYRKENREQYNQKNTERRLKDMEYQRQTRAEWRKKNREKVRFSARKNWLCISHYEYFMNQLESEA